MYTNPNKQAEREEFHEMNPQISVSEAAREAKVLPTYLYQLIAAGRLTGNKVNGRWVLNRESFDSWRDGHRANRRTAELVSA